MGSVELTQAKDAPGKSAHAKGNRDKDKGGDRGRGKDPADGPPTGDISAFVPLSFDEKRRNAFGQAARDYGLPSPKGLMIIGIPGTGKSLTAKATASVFGLPLLKLDAGKLFGGLVGQSEANLRSALGTAEAISPCVL